MAIAAWTGGTGDLVDSSILVIEDDDDQRSALCDVLEDHGYVVCEAADARQALRGLMNPWAPGPRLILLDLSMPNMTGWEFLNALKNHLGPRRIPVVLVTGYDDPLLDGTWHGKVDGVLRKPCHSEELLATVARYAVRRE